MVEKKAEYANYAPPKGHPRCWLFWSEPFELGYLSWGHRWYGDAPAPARMHDGWHYFIVLDGEPILEVKGRRLRTKPGTVSICHPDCFVGHYDEPGQRCEMLTWVWRTPPAHSAVTPSPGEFLRMAVEDGVLRRLKNLHGECREAVGSANELGVLQLRAARLQLDIMLLEGRSHRAAAHGDFRIQLAREFLRTHLRDVDTVKRLCEYLHISEASLKRLFHRHTGKSPREFALHWRMQWAREQLKTRDASVKSVAYALGYRHANDFSRAFKRHYGQTASGILNRSRLE